MFQALRGSIYIIIGGIYFAAVYLFYGFDSTLGFLSSYGISETILKNFSAFVIFVTLLGIFIFLEKIAKRVANKIVSRSKSKFDDSIVDALFGVVVFAKILLAFVIAFSFATVEGVWNTYINDIVQILLFILVLLSLTKTINIIFKFKLKERGNLKVVSKTLLPFLQKSLVVFIWVIGVLLLLSNLGFDVTAVIAGAGVGGIAIALAAQKSVSNIFGAITILLNKPFQLGDYVTIEGHTGVVKDIGLSYITLTDRNGHDVMIPNENIISSSIDNESRRAYRRADFAIGLIYDTTLEQMQKGVKIIEGILQKYVDEEKLQKFRVNFEAFGDFSLNINVTYFTNTNAYDDFVKEKESINLEIKKLFAKSKLEMAFPTTEMIIKGGDIK